MSVESKHKAKDPVMEAIQAAIDAAQRAVNERRPFTGHVEVGGTPPPIKDETDS